MRPIKHDSLLYEEITIANVLLHGTTDQENRNTPTKEYKTRVACNDATCLVS